MIRQTSYLVALVFGLRIVALFAQEPEEPKPTFTLSIEVDEEAAQVNPDLHRLLVKFTRTAVGDEVEQFHEEAKGMYEMIVLRDGVPARETDAMLDLRLYRTRDGHPTIRNPRLLRTGESWITPLDVSDYYEMTESGVYQVTVTRESDPGNLPAYNILVRSNTVTIVVPRRVGNSPNKTAEKPKPRFGLTVSPEDPDDAQPDLVLVSMENISRNAIRERKCWPFLGMYNFVVLRNGEPLEESKEMRDLQHGRAGVTCPGNQTLLEIEPGDTYTDRLPLTNYFDIHEPGSYVVYATRETYPYNPAKSVLVESNSISFVVPQPTQAEQGNPQTEASPSTPQ